MASTGRIFDSKNSASAFWAARDYLGKVDRIRASVFVVHGLNDYNVKPNNYDEWWDNLAANDVPRKIWLTQMGHVGPMLGQAHHFVRDLD